MKPHPPQSRTENLGVRLRPGVKGHLQQHADADSRSLSWLVEAILLEWLAAHPLPAGRVLAAPEVA